GTGKYRSVNIGFDLIMFMGGNKNNVATSLQVNTELTENIRDNAQVFTAHILDSDFTARHSSTSDSRYNLNHIGKDTMFAATQFFNTFYYEQIRTNAGDLCTH